MKRSLLGIIGVWIMASALHANPGDLLSVTLERSYTPSQIQTFIGPLFAGYPIPEETFTVDVYQAVVESAYPDGVAAKLYLQVFLPRFDAEAPQMRPVYAFGPGSTGLADNCRPSREHEVGIRWGLYRSHVLSHAGRGVIGMIPDYLGFRDTARDQYYMVAQAEAQALLDGLRGVSKILQRLEWPGVSGTKNFVAGFSQGGHAAFAAADWRDKLAPDVSLAGVIGYGPTTNIAVLMKEYPSVAPMMLLVYQQLYGTNQVDPSRVLQSQYAHSLREDVTTQCVGGMQSYYPGDAKNLFLPEFYASLQKGTLGQDYPSLARVLDANSPGLDQHETPVLILQGTDDIVIHVPSQSQFVDQLRAAGVTVDYRIMKGIRHDTRQAGFQAVQDWMFRG